MKSLKLSQDEFYLLWNICQQIAPSYLEVVHKICSSQLDVREGKLLAENLQVLDEQAFATDNVLRQELESISHGKAGPLGIVLISKREDVEGSC